MVRLCFLLFLFGSTVYGQGYTLPGKQCHVEGQCKSRFCCESIISDPGFCSACCLDSDCPVGDICIVQENLQANGINYRTCFPKNILGAGTPCWRNEMCQTGVCTGGSTNAWAIAKGRCLGQVNVECYEEAFDYFGNDVKIINNIANPRACQLECQKESNCNFFTYSVTNKICYLKSIGGQRQRNFDSVSGPKYCLGDCTTATFQKSDGNTYCGFFLRQGLTWEEAGARCERFGARLPEIRSFNDNQQIAALKPPTASNTTPLQGLWLGASDIQSEGVFRWRSNNQQVTFQFWSNTQPDNFGGNEDCLQMVYNQGGQWNDNPCNAVNVPQYTLCEKLVG